MQTRLIEVPKKRREADKEQLNYVLGNFQIIKTSEGCPNLCPYCYEDNKLVVWALPKIKKNKVLINDMNFLWQPDIVQRIKELGVKRVDGKSVYYELTCGIDYRLLTKEIAELLSKNRFGYFSGEKWIKGIRWAWDYDYNWENSKKQQKTFLMLRKAGYKDLSVYVLANWKIPLAQCLAKLDLFKVWNCKVCDCCYDGGYSRAVPDDWTRDEIDSFRKKCRKHNQLVKSYIDPELKNVRQN